MSTVVIAGVGGLMSRVGTVVGTSESRFVTQPDVDAFADVTGDRQWIHVDPERASAGPFGGTIVHGFFTLALLPAFAANVFTVTDVSARVNYGLAKVRFPGALPVGSEILDEIAILSAEPTASGVRVTFQHTVRIVGEEKPVCVAETITQFVS